MAKPKAEPVETPAEETYIYCILTRLSPDRAQYKPYGIELVPNRVMVEIPVPSEELRIVTENDEEGAPVKYVVLTLDGLKAVASIVADKIDEIHQDYIYHIQNPSLKRR